MFLMLKNKITTKVLLLALADLSGAQAFPVLSGSSQDWQALPGNYDYLNDHQTGQAAGDIVGSTTDPGFFTTYIAGENSHLGFRIRLDAPGGNRNNPVFDRFLWLGIDANLDGGVDAFLGVNRQGSNNLLQIYDSGGGLNNSPSTTSIVNTPFFSTSLVSTNYNFRAVDFSLDGGTTNDLGLNVNDYYVSFAMPIQQITAFFATQGITYNDSTPVRYVLATSTQANSLNQDLGGVAGGVNSPSTWEQLGGFTPLATASGGVIPEPTTTFLVALGMVGLLRRKRVQ